MRPMIMCVLVMRSVIVTKLVPMIVAKPVIMVNSAVVVMDNTRAMGWRHRLIVVRRLIVTHGCPLVIVSTPLRSSDLCPITNRRFDVRDRLVQDRHRCANRRTLEGPLPEYVLMYARDNVGPTDPAQPPSEPQLETAVTALRMLADPTRLRIMWHLCAGEQDVGSLAALVGAARPAVSQHLAKLRLAGLVRMHREGRRALYTARGGHVRRLVAEVLNAADHHLTGLADHD